MAKADFIGWGGQKYMGGNTSRATCPDDLKETLYTEVEQTSEYKC